MDKLQEQLFLAFCEMIASELYKKFSVNDWDDEESHPIEWFTFTEFANELFQAGETVMKSFADKLDESLLYVVSLKLDREKGIYGMDFKEDDKHTITFHIRRLP